MNSSAILAVAIVGVVVLAAFFACIWMRKPLAITASFALVLLFGGILLNLLGLHARDVSGAGHFWATLNPRAYDVPLWAGLALFVLALVLGFITKKRGTIHLPHLPHRRPSGGKKQTVHKQEPSD